MTHPGYIVCDLHRRRWVVVRMDAAGQAPTSGRMEKDSEELERRLAALAPPRRDAGGHVRSGGHLQMVLAVGPLPGDQSQDAPIPSGVNAVKGPQLHQEHTDARHLGQLLRTSRWLEAGLAPP